jgi:hypothetical protein
MSEETELEALLQKYSKKRVQKPSRVIRYTTFLDYRVANLLELMAKKLGYENTYECLEETIIMRAKEEVRKGTFSVKGTAAEELLEESS